MSIRTGSCYCGDVKVRLTGEPKLLAICHCSDCRKWSGSIGQLVTVYDDECVQVTGELVCWSKPGKEGENYSQRNSCAKCHGNVFNHHPKMSAKDICGGILDQVRFTPKMHCNYGETIMPIVDGLPKFKDFPKGLGGSDIMVDEKDPSKEIGKASG